jgi:hypothetical protein
MHRATGLPEVELVPGRCEAERPAALPCRQSRQLGWRLGAYGETLVVTLGDEMRRRPVIPSPRLVPLSLCRWRMDLHRSAIILWIGAPPTAIGTNLKRKFAEDLGVAPSPRRQATECSDQSEEGRHCEQSSPIAWQTKPASAHPLPHRQIDGLA